MPSLLTASLLCGVFVCAAVGAGPTTINANDPLIVPLGRTYPSGASGIGLSWLGGGASVTHTGKVLRATFAATTSSFKVTFSQSDEGYMPWEGVAWIPGSGQNETVTIGASSAGTINVVLNMANQYFSGSAAILSFTSDGSFTQSPTPQRVIHVLGDSITASTNIRGGHPGCADGGFQDDYSSSYAGIICPFFDASCSTVAVGGKGLVRNCCDSGTKLPQYYQQVSYDGAPFTFNDAPPDAFVVYTGTNDYSGGENPALDAAYTAALLDLMKNVTTVYYGTPAQPANTTFFALLGPMSPTLPVNATLAAIQQGTAAGYRIVLVNATDACGVDAAGQPSGCSDGCAGHPGVASHRSIARVLAPIVAAELGWPMPGTL